MFENMADHILLPFDVSLNLRIVGIKCELDNTANLNNVNTDEDDLKG